MGAKEGFSKIDGCNCTHCTPLAAALRCFCWCIRRRAECGWPQYRNLWVSEGRSKGLMIHLKTLLSKKCSIFLSFQEVSSFEPCLPLNFKTKTYSASPGVSKDVYRVRDPNTGPCGCLGGLKRLQSWLVLFPPKLKHLRLPKECLILNPVWHSTWRLKVLVLMQTASVAHQN